MKFKAVAAVIAFSALTPITHTLASQNLISQSILGSIDLSAPAPTWDDLLERVQDQASELNAGLSLGESHLESESANAVYSQILEAYLRALPTEPALRTCIEKLTGILNSTAYPDVEMESSQIVQFYGNSPNQTDFTHCMQPGFYRYLTYSGFFHQYPWAHLFPEIFPQTPVTTEDGNNIWKEMNGIDLMFVSQIDLPYIVQQEEQRLARMASTDYPHFLAEYGLLKKKIKAIRSEMEVVLSNPAWKLSKTGLILTQDNFPLQPTAFPNDHAYLLLTDRVYRLAVSPFFFLDEILKLGISNQKAFFSNFGQGSKGFLGAGTLAKDSLNQEDGFTAPGLDFETGGETAFASIENPDGTSTAVIVDPWKSPLKLRCFKNDSAKTSLKEGDCSAILK